MRSIVSVARFIASEAGALALSFAIAAPALLVMAGMATDYAFMVRYRTELQAVADAAAIAGARELSLANANQSQIIAASASFANYNLKQFETKAGSVDVDAQVIEASTAVKVMLTRTWTPFFAHLLFNDVTPITVSATARVVGGKICVVGLSTSSLTSVHMDNTSQLDAAQCGVYSLTPGSVSLQVDRDATLRAQLICVSGGYKSSSGSSISPAPVTDCPAIIDPLEDRLGPSLGGCLAVDLIVQSDTVLSPGTYCGGLKIQNGATVTFSPGTYVIKDGKFSVNNATITGDGVGYFLTGTGAVLDFAATSSISLSAPVSGDMAGLLFFEDRDSPTLQLHIVRSNDARQLVGTIYLPRGILRIEANAPVADESAYTAIVAWRLQLKEGPNLVLNADYSATDVPVPKALSGGRVVLTQ
jgi:Flp pilus assembly protein TadG